MEIKKYRVVCSQPKFSDDIYIDIAPDDGIIHDQIFFSRIMLHKQINNQPLSRLYGSIYLNDNNGEIEVEFPKLKVRKNAPDYEAAQKRMAGLGVKIIERYRKMKDEGQESTLYVYGIDQMFEMSESKNAEADAFERKRRAKMRKVEIKTASEYRKKHAEQLFPHSFQEERIQMEKEKFNASRERRIEGERKRASESMPAWMRFQKVYSGD